MRTASSRAFALLVVAASLALVAIACPADREPTVTPEAAGTPEPATLEPDEAGAFVWVAAEDAGAVVLLDVARHEVVESFDVPGRPHNLSVADDGTVVAALQRAGTVALIREGQVSVVELGGSPHDVKPWGDTVVVANEGDARVDLVSVEGEHLGSISLKANPHDLTVAPDRSEAWATMNGTDELAVVNLDAREVTRYIPTGQRPHDILFAPDGEHVWVTDWDGPLHVISRNGELVGSLDLGEEAHHLTFTPDGREAWVTDHGVDQVFVIDAVTYEVVAALPIPGGPHHVAVTGDGRWAAVADHGGGVARVFDVRERAEVAAVSVGAGPHGVWSAP